MAGSILVLGEVQDGKVKKTTFELLAKARELSAKLECKIHCALLGSGVEGLAAECGRYGADAIFVVDDGNLKNYSSGAYARALQEVIKESSPVVILATASPQGKDLLPKIGARL